MSRFHQQSRPKARSSVTSERPGSSVRLKKREKWRWNLRAGEVDVSPLALPIRVQVSLDEVASAARLGVHSVLHRVLAVGHLRIELLGELFDRTTFLLASSNGFGKSTNDLGSVEQREGPIAGSLAGVVDQVFEVGIVDKDAGVVDTGGDQLGSGERGGVQHVRGPVQ